MGLIVKLLNVGFPIVGLVINLGLKAVVSLMGVTVDLAGSLRDGLTVGLIDDLLAFFVIVSVNKRIKLKHRV